MTERPLDLTAPAFIREPTGATYPIACLLCPAVMSYPVKVRSDVDGITVEHRCYVCRHSWIVTTRTRQPGVDLGPSEPAAE